MICVPLCKYVQLVVGGVRQVCHSLCSCSSDVWSALLSLPLHYHPVCRFHSRPSQLSQVSLGFRNWSECYGIMLYLPCMAQTYVCFVLLCAQRCVM